MTSARKDAVALVAEALHMDPWEVDDTISLGVTPQWDSLAHLRLILSLEERLGRRLLPETIVAIAGLEDVIALIDGEV